MHDLVTREVNASALLALVPDQMPDIYAWEGAFVGLPRKGRGEALAQIAAERGLPAKTVTKKFYAWKKGGIVALVDRTACTKLWHSEKEAGLSPHDQELVKQWCGVYQRKNKPAILALMRAWREQRVTREQAERGLSVPHTATPLNPVTGYPRGWSDRNLGRYAPSEYETKAARIGRSAAALHRPLVYTTRANLYVGQYLLWDDMWHDHEAVDLDQRKRGRPLEFHGLDLASAFKFAWGVRTRVQRDDGTHEGLKGGDFRFLLASYFGAGAGYHPDGTTNIIEWGTAAVSEEIERVLYDATGGRIMFQRGAIQGDVAHIGQYAGRGKGNFRLKASLESLGNLIHNELAYLPGQTGMDRQHAPEEQHGRQKHTDALLCALSQLPAERIQWLQWDYCTIQQFRLLLDEVYARINGRHNHTLEGWDTRYVPDPARGGMRRMSPWEWYAPRRRPLVRIDEATTALLLGHEHGSERTVRNGMLEVRDGEVSGDVLRFDATTLPDREKFLTVLNPFDCARLWVFDARGQFIAARPRIASVDRHDVEAVHREMGRAAKTEAALLAPLRQRHLGEARVKAARHANNAAVLGNDLPADREARAQLREDAVPMETFLGDAPSEPSTLSPEDFL